MWSGGRSSLSVPLTFFQDFYIQKCVTSCDVSQVIVFVQPFIVFLNVCVHLAVVTLGGTPPCPATLEREGES